MYTDVYIYMMYLYYLYMNGYMCTCICIYVCVYTHTCLLINLVGFSARICFQSGTTAGPSGTGQEMCHSLGGKVEAGVKREFGHADLLIRVPAE